MAIAWSGRYFAAVLLINVMWCQERICSAQWRKVRQKWGGAHVSGAFFSLSLLYDQPRPWIDFSPGDRQLCPPRRVKLTTSGLFELTVQSAQPQNASPMFKKKKNTHPPALFALQWYLDNLLACLKRHVCMPALSEGLSSSVHQGVARGQLR